MGEAILWAQIMKKLFSILGLLFVGLVAPLHAEDDVEDEAAEEEVVISIPDMVSKATYVTKVKPKKKAYVYFFLRSHSACGPCRAITQRMNELYKEMKSKGAELIMLNGDPKVEAAKEWADDAKIDFPMIAPGSGKDIAAAVPGGGSGGTPNVMAVTADGEQIEGTSGSSKVPALVEGWKDMVKDAKKSASKKAAAAKKAKAAKKKKASRKKSRKAENDEDEL